MTLMNEFRMGGEVAQIGRCTFWKQGTEGVFAIHVHAALFGSGEGVGAGRADRDEQDVERDIWDRCSFFHRCVLVPPTRLRRCLVLLLLFGTLNACEKPISEQVLFQDGDDREPWGDPFRVFAYPERCLSAL